MATTTYVTRSSTVYKTNGVGDDHSLNDNSEFSTWELAQEWVVNKYTAAGAMVGIQACDCEITPLITEDE